MKLSRSDYNLGMLHDIMSEGNMMAGLVSSYRNIAPGKKTIVFAVDIEHSRNIVEGYRASGIAARHIDAGTPKGERAAILDDFRNGKFSVLSNVDIVSEGFDVPDCEAVQLARPTKSLALFMQQVGRCMRPAPGKEAGIVLDNAGLWLEHGLATSDREWSLEGVPKKRRGLRLPSNIVALRDNVYCKVDAPDEVEGMELAELTQEIERLLEFEMFLKNALERGHKPVSAFLRYENHLMEQNLQMTLEELEYCKRRLGGRVKSGFWYYRRRDLQLGENS